MWFFGGPRPLRSAVIRNPKVGVGRHLPLPWGNWYGRKGSRLNKLFPWRCNGWAKRELPQSPVTVVGWALQVTTTQLVIRPTVILSKLIPKKNLDMQPTKKQSTQRLASLVLGLRDFWASRRIPSVVWEDSLSVKKKIRQTDSKFSISIRATWGGSQHDKQQRTSRGSWVLSIWS